MSSKFLIQFHLSLIVTFFTFASEAKITPQEFTNSFNNEMVRNATGLLLPAWQKRMDDHTFVLVAGFFNEILYKSCFRENRDALVSMGVPPEQIFIVEPSSNSSVLYNMKIERERLERIFSHTGKKLVIVAHSKGAVEMLYLSMMYPEFIEKAVEKIYLVQASVKGSGIADFVLGEGAPIGTNGPLSYHLTMGLLKSASLFLEFIAGNGIQTLTRNTSLYRIEYVAKNYPEVSASISDKIYYIRSHSAPEKMTHLLQPLGRYLQKNYGDSDGLITVDDQYLDGVGTRLTLIEADHFELTVDSLFSWKPPTKRYALMKAIVDTVNH